MVFIRAPKIERVGPDVKSSPLRRRSGVLFGRERYGGDFHPELSDDTRVHQAFLDLIPDVHKTRGLSRENVPL